MSLYRLHKTNGYLSFLLYRLYTLEKNGYQLSGTAKDNRSCVRHAKCGIKPMKDIGDINDIEEVIFMQNLNIAEKFNANQFGIHSTDLGFVQECGTVRKFYEFYDGKKDTERKPGDAPYGQEWEEPKGLDYKPTQEIRNIVKKLIDKQARFMFSVPPSISCKPKGVTAPEVTGDKIVDQSNKDTAKRIIAEAEDKRQLIDEIFTKGDFWKQSLTAFKDCTIGKRVLLTVQANPGEQIRFRYFTMPEFKYQLDPKDITKLKQVCIVYQDERTRGMLAVKQIWYKWTYEMRVPTTQTIDEEGNIVETPIEGAEATCWYKKETVDGNNTIISEPVELENFDNTTDYLSSERPKEVAYPDNIEWTDTRLSQIPCRIILNGGLTGDIWGTSDVKELMDMANSYNRVNSDFRDALRFKMFEQPVFTDADSNSLKNVKIAPNAIIDLKTDPTLDNGEGTGRAAQAFMLSSTFNFVQAADSFLDRLKKDMYEHMDQPLPEEIKNVPSAKAMRFMFQDLVGRCEEKWATGWDGAITWVIELICEAIRLFNLYPERRGTLLANTLTTDVITHNYPIPEDEQEKKTIAIQEVEAKVKSHKTYIREFGDVEDEDMEWIEIMDEDGTMNESVNAGFMTPKTAQDTQNVGTETPPINQSEEEPVGGEDTE